MSAVRFKSGGSLWNFGARWQARTISDMGITRVRRQFRESYSGLVECIPLNSETDSSNGLKISTYTSGPEYKYLRWAGRVKRVRTRPARYPRGRVKGKTVRTHQRSMNGALRVWKTHVRVHVSHLHLDTCLHLYQIL